MSEARRGVLGLVQRGMDLLGETRRVPPTGALRALIGALAVVAVFAIGYLALFGVATSHLQISVFLLLLLPISFLTTTWAPGVERRSWIDYACAILAFVSTGWFAWNEPRYLNWMSGFDVPSWGDTLFGTALMLLCIDLCRRTVGFGLTATLGVLLVYVAFGQYIPGSFSHPAITYPYFVENQLIGNDGLFGDPLYVAASYAFLFVLFGNFYVISGGSQLFFDLAAAIAGRSIGGPAKACIVSSALYGSISGSPVADVATTGPISIPIMKRIGMTAERAGAIEASSSIGGALLPPVMGAVAFLMSNFTNIPYYLIAWYAVLPSLGYYLGIYVLVHFEAVRFNLGRVPEDQIVGFKVALMRNWPSLIPMFVLLWLLVAGFSPAYVAAGSAISVVLASWLGGHANAIGPKRFLDGCIETCESVVPLTAAVAAGGLLIGAIELTGLAGKFTLLLFELSGGFLVPSLFLAGVILILLGTGMPTTATYIMGVALMAPVFVGKFGLPVMEVHMFMLFYASLSAITPPVAVAAFAAAAIAGANPFKLAPYACKLSVGGFVVPYFFIFNPGILMQGSVFNIVSDTLIASVLVISASLTLHGYVRRRPIPMVLRAVFAVAALIMIVPNLGIQYAAAAAAAGLFYVLHRSAKSTEATLAAAEAG